MKTLRIIFLFACALSAPMRASELKRFDAPVQYIKGATVLDQAHFEVAYQKPYLEKIARNTTKGNVIKGGYYHYLLTYRPEGQEEKTPVRYSRDDLLKEVKEKDHFEAIIAIIWYLYGEAINKEESFQSGAMVVDDPAGHLYEYLHAYALRSGVSANEDLYSIDITTTVHRLPGGNKHIVFAPPAPGATSLTLHLQASAIDPQELYARDLVFVKKAIKKDASELRKEIDEKQTAVMPDTSSLRNWLITVAPLIAADDDKTKRHKLLPLSVVARFGALVLSSDSGLSGLARKEVATYIRTKGLAGILERLDNWANDSTATQAFRDDALLFASELERQFDHARKRFGQEVILTKQELWSDLYYYLDTVDYSQAKVFFDFGTRLLKAKRAMQQVVIDELAGDEKKLAADMETLRDLINGRRLQPVMKSLDILYRKFKKLDPKHNEALIKYLGTVAEKARKRVGIKK